VGLPVRLSMQSSLPCTDPGSDADITFALTSGVSQATILDFDNTIGQQRVSKVQGVNFSCTDWQDSDAPGRFVLAVPALNQKLLGGGDVITTFTFDGSPIPPTATPTSVPNDLCGNATVITSVPYTTTMGTTGATSDSTEPLPPCGNRSRNKSVWSRFTAPSSGALTANTFGSNYDTILSVYTGTCGAFSPAPDGCNDDAGGGHQSQVSFTARAGVTYWFMVSAYSNDGGTLVFNLSH